MDDKSSGHGGGLLPPSGRSSVFSPPCSNINAMKNSFLTELQNIKCTEDMAIKLHDLAMKRLKDRHNHLLQKKMEKSCASITDALTLLTEASAAVKLLHTDLNMIAEETKSALNLLCALLPPVDSGLNLSADPSVPLADSESKMKSNESSSDPSPDPAPAPAPAAKNEKTHPPTNAEEELRPSLNSLMNKHNDAVKLLDNMSEMDQTQDKRAEKISAVIERISTLIWSLIEVQESLEYGLLD
ncbi:uncharacterized protein LOC116025833 isoform X4 [Ipomoea triloba]|uniref:uncharacterized protein LOC116025833 isoform X4 n=1 Tax=Ipomoea triloba TaxID=35885 RepID=UPI00125DA895|nr:uncharacterized protein LOC116025833 isoform X4 [Ipomoea triloba]